MGLRKEQAVLLATVLVLGYLAWNGWESSRALEGSATRVRTPEFEHHEAPVVDLVLPGSREDRPENPRELFSPPSDTRPLAPLAFVPPPVVPLPILRPPPDPGPAPKFYGRYLRTEPRTIDARDLFADDGASAGDGGAETTAPAASEPSAAAAASSAQDKADRITSYKKLYDWYRIVDLKFGQILNADRYGLKKRPTEDLLFVEFNPATGVPRLPGQGPIPIKRAPIVEFDFADTVQNQIEIRRAEFGDPLSASEYDEALLFARSCVERRLETPRALEVAEEIFERAAKVSNEDPLPRLGLARCHELGFQFEKAFNEYRSMLATTYARNPLVLVRLAELEARFRMTEQAEEHFAEADRYGRTSWMVQGAIGRFFRSRGRPADAVAHLVVANQHEPTGPELKHARALLRVELASALLEAGDLDQSREWFTKALQADASEQSAVAGLLSIASMQPRAKAANGGASSAGSSGRAPGDDVDASGSELDRLDAGGQRARASFEFVLASGLESLAVLDAQSALRAKEYLLLAASLDPLRAYCAWRALSYLAEASGHPEEALRYIELAVENRPSDVWSLYQRGRLLAARDDVDGAFESFSRALEHEVEFTDALAALGEILHRRGDFAAAERYFERALELDPTLTAAMTLRGINALEQGALREAEASFRQALARDGDQPTARNGLAWCAYAKGESDEALTRFRELDDNRRAFPASDPHRVYAEAAIARISDHLQKVVWSDRFERRSLMNGWDTEEKHGPQFSIHDGVVSLNGTFKAKGRSRMWQLKNAGAFVAFEARLVVKSTTTARVGIFVSREMQRAAGSELEAEVTVSRHNEPGKNLVQTRVMKRGEEELPYTDAVGFEWKLDTPVVLRIERTGESSDTKVRILVDGFPVVEAKPAPNLGRTTSELRVGIFAEGEIGRQVAVDIDDVEVVYRAQR